MQPSGEIIPLIKSKWSFIDNLEFLRKVENWIYKSTCGQYFVRVTDHQHRSLSLINAELNWMQYLENQGIKFAHPLKSDENKLVEVIQSHSGEYYISVFKKARGGQLIFVEDFTPVRLKNWGKIIGEMHSATLHYYPEDNSIKRPEWNTECNYLEIKKSCTQEDPYYDSFEKMESWLCRQSQENNVYGLIHADLHYGNFFVNDENKIEMFDFDDCHYNWYCYDLAVPFFTLSINLRNECNAMELKKMYHHFIEGYKHKGILTDEWLKKIPCFVLYRHFIIYFWAKRNLNNNDLAKRTQNWMGMAMKFCGTFIEKFRYSLLEE